jgi:1-acyl-sn-glycerol-3-phosphate acyltransferase
LVIANHVSWWDGFWVQYLNKEVIHRKLCFMMLEDQLRKHWYFRFSGGFSVKKKSRSIFESIHYSIELLEQPKNMVLMFPQGKIHSIYQDTVKFEKGVDRIIKNVSQETQLVFVANLVDYFSDRKPNLYIYIKSLLVKDVLSSTIEVEYNTFYKQVLHTQKTKIS